MTSLYNIPVIFFLNKRISIPTVLCRAGRQGVGVSSIITSWKFQENFNKMDWTVPARAVSNIFRDMQSVSRHIYSRWVTTALPLSPETLTRFFRNFLSVALPKLKKKNSLSQWQYFLIDKVTTYTNQQTQTWFNKCCFLNSTSEFS